MKKISNLWFVTFLLFSIFILNVSSSLAAATTEEGIQISPSRFDWVVDGGQTKSGEIIIHNFSDTPHDIKIEIEDFFVSDDSQMVHFFVPADDHPLKAYDVINWIDIPDDFTLEPGDTKKVQLVINIPEGQPTSGYYGSIFFKTKTGKTMAQNDSGEDVELDVNYRVGSLITLAVQGDEPMQISGYVEEFYPLKTIFWDSPMTIFARLKSEGNVHYKVNGQMQINKFGNKFAIVKIDDQVMYPDKIRIFEENIAFGMWDYGIYSAILDIQSEDGSVIFRDEIPFFLVIPWKTTILLLSGILIIFAIIKAFRKKFAIVDKKKIKQETVKKTKK